MRSTSSAARLPPAVGRRRQSPVNHDAAGERFVVLNEISKREPDSSVTSFQSRTLVDATCIRPRGASSARLLAVALVRASAASSPARAAARDDETAWSWCQTARARPG